MSWLRGWCAVLALISCQAQAVVSLAGTRLVFDGRFREATIEVSNPGDTQVLIQAWLSAPPADLHPDSGADPRADKTTPMNLPFVLTPHLAQLPAKGRQVLRVLYEGSGMPVDRESLLHLYVLEVPRRSEAKQQLSIAVRQRINVFYRPEGLAGDPADAPQTLTWQWLATNRSQLLVRNPTPFHVSLLGLAIDGTKVSAELMLGPFSHRSLTLPSPLIQRVTQATLRFNALTDYGGQREFCAAIPDSTPFSARLSTPGAHPPIGKCGP